MNEIKTQLSVSNQDVITMLAVENRKKLKIKREQLWEKFDELRKKEIQKCVDKFDKYIKSTKSYLPLFNAYKTLLKTLNPKFSFEIKIGDNAIIPYYFYDYYGKREKNVASNKLTINSLPMTIIFDESHSDEEIESFKEISQNHGDNIDIPIRFKYEIPENSEVRNLFKQINEIDDLIKNEKNYIEEITAKVTANAINNMPEMKYLVDNINLLSLDM
jgi:hypothetical protein